MDWVGLSDAFGYRYTLRKGMEEEENHWTKVLGTFDIQTAVSWW